MKLIEQFNKVLNERALKDDKKQHSFQEVIEIELERAISLLPNKNKMICLGAGNLSDIPLRFVLRFFDEIVLTDIDVSSMVSSIKNLNFSYDLKDKLDLRRIEYTGFEVHHFFEDLPQKLYQLKSKEKIESVLKKRLTGLDAYQFLKEEKEVDLVYISPIYTQLLYQQVLDTVDTLAKKGMDPDLRSFIMDFMLDEMVHVIDRFNTNVLRILAPSGILFVLSDILELKSNSSLEKEVLDSKMDQDKVEEIYQDYLSNYGMGLGDYGLYNLDEKRKSISSKWLHWPFDETRSFLVKCKIYKNKNGGIL